MSSDDSKELRCNQRLTADSIKESLQMLSLSPKLDVARSAPISDHRRTFLDLPYEIRRTVYEMVFTRQRVCQTYGPRRMFINRLCESPELSDMLTDHGGELFDHYGHGTLDTRFYEPPLPRISCHHIYDRIGGSEQKGFQCLSVQDPRCWCEATGLSLLLSCRAIFQEALQYAYARRTFVIADSETMIDFSRCIRSHQRGHMVQSLCLHFEYFEWGYDEHLHLLLEHMKPGSLARQFPNLKHFQFDFNTSRYRWDHHYYYMYVDRCQPRELDAVLHDLDVQLEGVKLRSVAVGGLASQALRMTYEFGLLTGTWHYPDGWCLDKGLHEHWKHDLEQTDVHCTPMPTGWVWGPLWGFGERFEDWEERDFFFVPAEDVEGLERIEDDVE